MRLFRKVHAIVVFVIIVVMVVVMAVVLSSISSSSSAAAAPTSVAQYSIVSSLSVRVSSHQHTHTCMLLYMEFLYSFNTSLAMTKC